MSIGLADVPAMRLRPMTSVHRSLFMAATFMMLQTSQYIGEADFSVFNSFEVRQCLMRDQVELRLMDVMTLEFSVSAEAHVTDGFNLLRTLRNDLEIRG